MWRGRQPGGFWLPAALMLAAAFSLLTGARLASGFPWSRDMKNQPSVKPQEAPRPPAKGTVPRERWEPPIPTKGAATALRNPVPATPASIANGRRLYQIYCLLCHGADGKGFGPITDKYVPAADLTGKAARAQPDGALYQAIRSGGALMPRYDDALTPSERWDVINYLRSLQQP